MVDIFEHYKETYHNEIKRRGDLYGELSIPIGLITVLATGVFYYFTNFDFKDNVTASVIFVILLIAGACCLIMAMYYLLESYNITHDSPESEYDYLAYASDQRKYYDDLKASFKEAGNDDEISEQEAIKGFEKYLLDKYINAAAKNTGLNDLRAAHLFKCKRFILMALIVLLTAFIPYSINFFVKGKSNNKIEVTKSVILLPDSAFYHKVTESMSTNTNNTQNTQAPKPVIQPAALPKPPENRHIKEGQIPVKPKIYETR